MTAARPGHRSARRRTRAVLTTVTCVAVLSGCAEPGPTAAAGLRVDGRFMTESGIQVVPDALGPVLHRELAIRDTTGDVRAVRGVPPADAIAVSYGRPRGPWLLFARDPDVAAVPTRDPRLRGAVA